MIPGYIDRIGRIDFIEDSIMVIAVFEIMLLSLLYIMRNSTLISTEMTGGDYSLFLGFIILLLINSFIHFIKLAIRRIHDFNASGWWVIIMVLPIISLILWLIPGTRSVNKYGKQPLDPGLAKTISVCVIVSPVVILTIFSIVAIGNQKLSSVLQPLLSSLY